MPPHLTLKHITSLTFGLPYLSSTSGVRSTRQLLAALPAKPSPKHAAVPQVIVQATKGAEAWIEAVYSDKKKLRVDTGSDMTVEQLFRKVREHERESVRMRSRSWLLKHLHPTTSRPSLADRGTGEGSRPQGAGHLDRRKASYQHHIGHLDQLSLSHCNISACSNYNFAPTYATATT